jgi:hypothetical protein
MSKQLQNRPTRAGFPKACRFVGHTTPDSRDNHHVLSQNSYATPLLNAS